MQNICLYHGTDLDGFCSGAIYAQHAEVNGLPAKLIPANYGWDLPWEEFTGAEVTLIDFSIQPFSEFERLIAIAKHVLWIDHHKSAIDDYCKAANRLVAEHAAFNVMVDVEQAGCELAWEYYFPHQPVPRGVHLLGRYDVWDHSADADIMPYQYGMRLKDLDPVSGKNRSDWSTILRTGVPRDVDGVDVEYNSDRIREGALILWPTIAVTVGPLPKTTVVEDMRGQRAFDVRSCRSI